MEEICGKRPPREEIKKAIRIVADHLRCATFIMGDERGVSPSNVDQGYVLQRLIRRAVRFGRKLDLPAERLTDVAQAVIDTYQEVYPELAQNRTFIMDQLRQEVKRFSRTLEQGVREFERVAKRPRTAPSTASPLSTCMIPTASPSESPRRWPEAGLTVDTQGFEAAFSEHRKKSQAGSQQRFAGGLVEANEVTARLHTATHLLLASLKRVLGEDVNQKGSNITPERLRFDFNFGRKMTPEEKQQVEDLVNDAIRRDLPITMEEMTVEEAKAAGATGVFTDRYGEKVKVYTMGDFSKEICGGPTPAAPASWGYSKSRRRRAPLREYGASRPC